ncbi:MAG: phosphate ABC transporter substrate-binding protein PstS [Prevotellaceae bacterium]|jgi:phosphate transport system substrate-binding protein|nr:phosphate ABC transporter substrate-binding protein PstS [Prevotellaceae bacterium]
MKNSIKILVFVSFAALLASCTNSSENISGAGATFPAPFYNIVIKDYAAATGDKISYGATGSGAGIRSLKDKTVDFGATDLFLSDMEMEEMGARIVHIPTCLGAVVMSYNLKGVENLKLNSSVVSQIYAGKITNWNDVQIKQLNPEIALPDKAITPVYRSDGSGTTAVFSEYMDATDSLWHAKTGKGKSLNFSTGIAAKGNSGVAGVIAETEGSIGYIGSEYAFALNLAAALFQNSSGKFIKADAKSISAAANRDMPDDTRISIVNAPDSNAYPISTFTWIITYKNQNYNARTEEHAQSLKRFLNYIISAKGQAAAEKTFFAPIPPAVIEKARAAVESIEYGD